MNIQQITSFTVFLCKFYSLFVFGLKLKESDNVISRIGSNISTQYFSNYICVVVVVEENNLSLSLYTKLTLSQYKSSIIVFVEEPSVLCSDENLLQVILQHAFEQKCMAFIIQLPEPSCFLASWKAISKKSLFRHNPRILFLPTDKSHIISPSIKNYKEIQFFVDIVIIDMYPPINTDSDVTFEVVTLNASSELQTVSKCSINTCKSKLKNLYPDKMFNFNQRALKVATFEYAPYSILNPLDGTELRIISEFNRIHNCTTDIVTDGAEWGKIHENGTGDGILGNVAEERADVGLAALYLWYHEYQFLDFSMPYIRTGITCLAPKPKQLSKILLPARPFNAFTWLVVLCFVVLSGTALYLTKKTETFLKGNKNKGNMRKSDFWFSTKQDTLLRTFGILLLQAYTNHTVEHSSIRQLVNCFHVMVLLIATSYNSGLASILTVPSYLPPIETVTDLVNSGLPWGATHDAWIFSLREATEPKITTLVNKFRALTKEQLHYNSIKGDFAFSIERLPAGHFAVGDYITEESMKHLRLMRQDIYYEYCILVFPKGSPYLNSFNRLIHRLLESGLLLFWEGEVTRKFLNSTVQSAIRDSLAVVSRAHPNPLQLSHLQGAFFILSIGLLLSFIIFIVELFTFNNIKSNILNHKPAKQFTKIQQKSKW